MKKAILPALVLTLSLTFAIWGNRPSAPISKDVTAVLAASLANQEATARFGVAPFSPAKGEVVIDHGQWVWTSMRGYGYSDLTATVTVAEGKPLVVINQNVLSPWE